MFPVYFTSNHIQNIYKKCSKTIYQEVNSSKIFLNMVYYL